MQWPLGSIQMIQVDLPMSKSLITFAKSLCGPVRPKATYGDIHRFQGLGWGYLFGGHVSALYSPQTLHPTTKKKQHSSQTQLPQRAV